MEEVWKNVVGLEGYQVSNLGNVRSLNRKITDKNGVAKNVTGRFLRTSTDSKGYKVFTTHEEGKRVTHRVHNLVYQTFAGIIPNGKEIDHIDRNTSNNNLTNLRLVDRRENNLNRCNTKKNAGVVFSGKNYSISIYFDGKAYNLGTEQTEEMAHEVYNKAKESISNGTFKTFYQSRKFNKIQGLPKYIFYHRKRGVYSASIKGKHIAQSKDLEYVKSKLREYLQENG